MNQLTVYKALKYFFTHLKAEQWILLGLVILYIAYFTFFTFQKHQLFLTGRYDLGNMDQTVWNTFHGRIFLFTNPDFDEVMSRLSVHSDFILILLAPFYALWADPRTLLLIQTIVIASGAFFVYLLGKRILKKPIIPLILAFSYLLNPYVERQNIFDFHSVSLATMFLLGAFYFLESNKRFGFFIFLFLAVLTKEHIFLIAMFFGIYLFFFKKKTWGIALALVSPVIFYLLISVFIPQARGQEHFAVANYKSLGDSPLQVAIAAFTNPLAVFKLFAAHGIFSYLGYLFLPIGFLSILAPIYLLFALPEFMVNALSGNGAYRLYYYHYAAASIPFIYISAIFGIQKLLVLFPSKRIFLFICIYLFSFSLFSAWWFGPLPGAKKADLSIFKTHVMEKEIHAYLNQIPERTAVAASNNLAAQLVHREKIYTLKNGVKKADLILFLVPDLNDERNTDVQMIQKLFQNSQFHVVYRLDNFIVFERKVSN